MTIKYNNNIAHNWSRGIMDFNFLYEDHSVSCSADILYSHRTNLIFQVTSCSNYTFIIIYSLLSIHCYLFIIIC